MTLELRYDQARAVTHDPKDGVRATTATLTLWTAGGVVLEAPTVTKPTASGVVQAGSTALSVTLDTGEAAAFEVGERVKLVSGGVTYLPTVAVINGDTLVMRASLSEVPDTGATVTKIRLSATLAAAGLDQLGTDNRLEWVYSDGTTPGFHTEGVSIVRWPWVSPVSADDVRVHLADVYRDDSASAAFCADIAARAGDKIAQAMRASGRRAHLFPDPSVLGDSTWQAVRWLLAEQGFVPEGDAAGFVREMRYALNDGLTTVIKSLSGYDADNSGTITADEKKGHVWSFPVSR